MLSRRSLTVSLIMVLAFGLIGCATQNTGSSTTPPDRETTTSKKFQSDVNAPDWFFNPPQKEGSIFNAATATSSRFSVALSKAKLKAKRGLATTLQSTLQGQRERYVEEIGNTSNSDQETQVREQYQDLIREMVSQELQGVRLVQKGIVEEKSGYRAYVLMELTMDDITSKLNNKEELKTRFNAKQFQEDMEENLRSMREQQ